ncbi:N-acetylmuramoyl-L-alanine amidase, partial [Streptomyces sp. TRM76130]|nr:N-acetylmuramoyl-L-alanine amidase [Streptomyces sp. TRM76130]
MSYTGPESSAPHQPRRSPPRRPLTVALAALVPGALLGWGVYATVGAPGADGGGGRAAAGTTASASSSPGPGEDTADAAPADTPAAPLRGRTVVIDPGHNPAN